MLLLKEIEDAIAALIKTPMEILGVRVRVTPETDSGVNTRGTLLIGYTGSSFSSVSQKIITQQQRTLEYELSLAYKDLQTHKDNYLVIETLLKLLTGFQPLDCDGEYGALYPSRDSFIGSGEGFWRYALTFQMIVDHPLLEHSYE